MTPRGVRNNNPGNIIKSKIPWRGKLVGTDPRFEVFDTPENGIAALAGLLLKYKAQGINTIVGAMTKWAPPIENDTGAYVKAVAEAVGYSADTLVDFSDPSVLRAMTVAIIKHENGVQPYSDAQLTEGLARALGTIPEAIQETKPMSPLLLPAILQILQTTIPMLGQLWGNDPKKAAGTAVASAVVDTVVKATNAANAQDALEKIQADESAKATAEQAIKDEYFALQTMAQQDKEQWERDERSLGEARRFGLSMLTSDGWQAIGFGALMAMIAIVVLVGGGIMLWFVLKSEFAAEIKAGIVGSILTLLSQIVSYFFGSSSDSRAKTQMLARGR